jgi:hypothetical protein
VSPSWRDRVTVALAPHQVQLVRYGKGLRPQVAQRRVLPCAQSNGTAWRPALDALARGVQSGEWQGADAHVAVSNHFVRFALVPEAHRLRDEAERTAAARHQLHALYGDAIDSAQIVLSSGGGATALAAAIEPGLIEALVATLTGGKLRPRAIEPLLVLAFNQCRQQLSASTAWLAVHEAGWLAFAYLDRGTWQKLRSQRLRGSLTDELPILLERSRLADGGEFAAGRVLLLSRETTRIELPRSSGWSIETVPLVH